MREQIGTFKKRVGDLIKELVNKDGSNIIVNKKSLDTEEIHETKYKIYEKVSQNFLLTTTPLQH